jgi:suppressor for copper-sensitivity B
MRVSGAFDRAMRAVPGTSGVSADLSAWLSGDKLVITGTTDGKWDNPGIYFDPLEGIFCPASRSLNTTAIRFG